jgi:hypothetical protein
MKESKYICIDYGLAGDTIFIFPEYVVHKDVAHAMGGGNPIISAGFVRRNHVGNLVCYGESESLGIKSRPDADSALANMMFGGKM